MNILRTLALLGVGWSLAGAIVSCQDRDVSHGTSSVSMAPPDEGLQVSVSCVPGQTIECRGGCGEPAAGYQVCAADGRSYLPCVCPPLRLIGPITSVPNRSSGERRIFPRSPLVGSSGSGTGGSSGFSTGGGPIGGGSGGGTGLVGASCRSNADCIAGLGCFTAGGSELAAGSPAGGYCSAPCGSSAACAALDPASECIGLAGQNMCVRSCASREPAPNESKCLGRDDVMCVSVAALGQEPPGEGPQTGLCVPACQSDRECGPGLFCNLGNGLCTAVRPTGAPIGSSCTQAEDCASGLCLTLNDTFESFCSGFCSFGVPGCGYDGSEAQVGATCLLTQVRDEGPGDRGLCFASCDSNADCLEPGAVCVPAASDGRAGVCLVPAEQPPLPPGTTPVIGNACEQSADCGAGFSCLTSSGEFLGIPGGPAGGYCSSTCGADGSCPEPGTLCVTRGGLSQCLRACDPTANDDCGGRDTLVCQAFATGDPTRGFCRPECSADAQCGERVCDLAAGLCVDPPEGECEEDADCESGEVCLTAFGTCLAVPVECLNDGDCEPGSECELATNTCVAAPPECVSDEQCGAGVCDTELGLCVDTPPRCSSDAECGEQVCDVAEGVCVAPPAGCTSDADCGEQVCDLALGVCVAPPPECLTDADCPGEACDEALGACVPASPECTSNADCGLEVCDVAAGVCVAAPECSSDADCPGRVCDPQRGVCVDEPSCALDADCPGGVCDPSAEVCIAAPPVPAGGACQQDSQCAGELCASVDGETSFCTAFCLLGTAVGCEPYGTDNFCLLPIDPNDDQFGICIELCNTAADCAQPGYECVGIGGSINGRTGGCLPPLPPPPPAPPAAQPAP